MGAREVPLFDFFLTRETKQQASLSHFASVIYLSFAVAPNEAKEKKLAESSIGPIDNVIKVARYKHIGSHIPLFVIEMVIYTVRTQS